jgi:beta-lactamase regulating signal transducer with metallopeptidase domain
METLWNTIDRPILQSLALFLLHTLWIGAISFVCAWLSMAALRKAASSARCNVLLIWLAAIPIVSVLLVSATSQPESSDLAVKNGYSQTTKSSQPPSPKALRSENTQRSPDVNRRSTAISHDASGKAKPILLPGAKPARHDVTAQFVSTNSPKSNVRHNARIAAEKPVQHWLKALVVLFWFTGVAMLWVRMLFDWLQLRRWVRNGANVDQRQVDLIASLQARLSIKRTVQLKLVEDVAVPIAVGVLRPMILVPTICIAQLSPAQLEAIFIHELSHIRRCDFVVNLFQRVIETLLFFHPGVWWLGRQIRQEREHACDDTVIKLTSNRVTYARALTAVAGLSGANALALPASSETASSGPFKSRIQRIVGSVCGTRLPQLPLANFGGCIVGVAMLLWILLPASTAPSVAVAGSPQPSASSKTSAKISGIIFGPENAPLENATVVIRCRDYDRGGHVDIATKTTSAKGQFEFDAVAHPTSRMDVIARKPGHSVRWVKLDRTRNDIKLRLLKATKFKGRLMDDAGEPVVGAVVKVVGIMSLNTLTTTDDFERSLTYQGGDSYIDLTETKPLATISDIDGRFEIDELPYRVGLQLTVDDKRFPNQIRYAATTDEPLDSRAVRIAAASGDGTRLEILRNGATITLRRSVNVKLTFLDEATGAPIENVLANPMRANDGRPQLSDKDGVVTFNQIPQDAVKGWAIRFSSPPDTTWPSGLLVNQDKPNTELQVELEVRLQKGTTLEGQVVDESTGKGLADAEIGLLNPILPHPSERFYLHLTTPNLTSDEAGRFRLLVPRSGQHAATQQLGTQQLGTQQLGTQQLGTQHSGTLNLVRSPRGYEPVPQNMNQVFHGAVKDAIDSESSASRFAISLATVKPGDQPVFRLKRRPTIQFRFVDPAGNPTGVKIRARTWLEPGVGPTQVDNPPVDLTYQTNADQTFDASELLYNTGIEPSGFYMLIVSEDEKLGAFYSANGLHTSGSETTITLEPVGTITGIVKDKVTDVPVIDAQVSVQLHFNPNVAHSLADTTSNEDGKYSFGLLVPGIRYMVNIASAKSDNKDAVERVVVFVRPGSKLELETLFSPTAPPSLF